MLEYPHGDGTLLGYNFSYPNIRPKKKEKKKKKKKKKKNVQAHAYPCQGERIRWHGTVGKNVPNSSTVKLTFQKLGPNVPDFCLDLEENGLFCIFGFKTALFTVIILIKSAPSTATQVKLHAFSARDLRNCRVVW